MVDEPIQLSVIELDQFPDLQIEDLPQFRDFHDIHVFRLNEVFQMERGEGPFPWKGEKIEEVSIVTAILIGLDVLKKERGPFESLRDFEMVVAQLFIVTEVFRPDPRRFEKLHRIHQFSVEAEIARILEVAVLPLLLPSSKRDHRG